MAKTSSSFKSKSPSRTPKDSPSNRRGTGTSISIVIPDEVYQWLRRYAFENETTLRSAVLHCVREAGGPVSDEEIMDRRKR